MQQPKTSDSNNQPNYDYRQVAAANGLLWLTQGFKLFKINPTLWLLTSTILIFALLLLAIVPFSMILAPTLFAGTMAICHHLKTDKVFKLDLLLAGFKSQLNALLIAGVVYVLAMSIFVLIAMEATKLLGFADFSAVITEFSAGKKSQADAIIALELLLPTIVIMIPVMLLVTSAFWFVPALIILRACPPLQAIKLSLMASLVNFIPFLIYSLLTFIGMNLLGIFLSVILIFIPVIVAPLILISYLLIYSLLIASIYTSFDNIFPQDDDAQKNSDSPDTEPSNTLVA